MEERPTPAIDTPVPTTEFEFDVTDLLVETLRGAIAAESRTVGTEHLLRSLVMGDSEAGEALAPGMRNAGALSGMISARSDGPWARDDEAVAEAEAEADGGPTGPGDEAEVTAAWREARWQVAQGSRRAVPPADGGWPEPTGALRACLLHALRLACREGTPSVRGRHVARALLELPGTRAMEALMLRRTDPAAAFAALDTLDTRAAAETAGPESRAVALLLKSGTLGEHGQSNWLARKAMSWMSQTTQDGTLILFAVSMEAKRQAVRCGRDTVEPVDLLLAVLALDRALSVAGRSLPEDVAPANEAAALLRTYGVRPASLVLSAATATDSVPVDGKVPLSAAADRARAATRLMAAERGASEVGTVHLVATLLDDEGPVVRLLRADGVDVAGLKKRLGLLLGA